MSAQAEVYRWFDENNRVVFSDRNQLGAEEVIIESLSSYTPVSRSLTNSSDSDEENSNTFVVPNYQVEIMSPQDDEAVRSNAGIVNINAKVEPTLSADRNDQIILKLDGRILGQPSSSQNFTLTDIDRGTHTLQVAVVDKSGNLLKTSTPVSFHLQRHSVAP